MPKTVTGLWPQVASWPALVAAYQRCRKGKREQPKAVHFHAHWEERLVEIQQHLVSGTWQPDPLTSFPIYAPKYRIIEAPTFRDRIVHHALVGAVEPHFERRFIRQSYACRKGGGTHRAVADMQRHLRRAEARWGRVYALQIDVSKYFPSIQHDRLLEQIARTISDRRVLTIWERIIRGAGRDVGLPIGALTSQLSGNIYLDWLDHMVKDEMGIREYGRYMDDAVLLLPSKAEAWRAKRLLEDLLRDELGLKLSKALVYPTTQGVDWAGYRTWSTHMLPRRRNILAARRRMRDIARDFNQGRVGIEDVRQRVASFIGHTQHCDAHRVTQTVLDDLVLARSA